MTKASGYPGDGTRITDQWKQTHGVTFDTNRPYGLLLYDTACKGKNGKNGYSANDFTDTCTGGDPDLATGKGAYKNGRSWYGYDTPEQGNVLIIQENKGNTPDDFGSGGKVFIDFDLEKFASGITFDKFGFVDLDEAVIRNQKLNFTFSYADGRDDFTINNDNYEAYITDSVLSKQWDFENDTTGGPLEGDNSLREYTFNNSKGEFDRIQRIMVNYQGASGAIASFDYSETGASEDTTDIPEPGAVVALGLFALGTVRTLKKQLS
ncbi:MAG: hypothetical protein HC886_06495 [Leptolyngbyaceae cyanobacterium SM1_1_3]|nr:hypothetical protein [Leptolyngbyaceae cyanobacterium SM1_1_3]NJN01660.1 hypothetical protein [Leptolyngbyaceae cyanobacterium RM1_1_2]